MKQRELIEIVQQHHGAMKMTEIRRALNRAQNDFCARTELIKQTYIQTSVAGRRYYTIDENILRILDVQINDVSIPRLQGSPIIDDDEFDNAEGLTAGSTSSNERYWYVHSNRLAIVEKVNNAVTRDDKTSDFQSISEAKEIRLNTISQATDFTSNLNDVSDLPVQFHESLACKVISDGYLHPPTTELEVSKAWYAKYMDYVQEGRKFARSGYIKLGNLRQTHF